MKGDAMNPYLRQARPLIAASAVLVSAVAFLAGCGSASSQDPPQSVVTVTATPSEAQPITAIPSHSASPVPLTSPTSPASSVKPSPGGSANCLTSALRAALGPAQGAAGSAYQVVNLANISRASCTLYGFPGVSFVTGIGGSQIGKAAARDRTTPRKVVTLAPGQSGSFVLRIVNTGTLPTSACVPVTVHWLKIFPPASTAALYLSYTARACSDETASILTTRVVTDGTGGQS
jgi:hypothetical protein